MRSYLNTIVALICHLIVCGVNARADDPTLSELLDGSEFELPTASFAYVGNEVVIIGDEEDYDVESFIDELDRVQFIAIPSSSGSSVYQIEGTLDLTSSGMPRLEFYVEYADAEDGFEAGTLTTTQTQVGGGTQIAVLFKKCTCSSVQGHCRPFECDNQSDCNPGRTGTNFMGPYGQCSNSPSATLDLTEKPH